MLSLLGQAVQGLVPFWWCPVHLLLTCLSSPCLPLVLPSCSLVPCGAFSVVNIFSSVAVTNNCFPNYYCLLPLQKHFQDLFMPRVLHSTEQEPVSTSQGLTTQTPASFVLRPQLSGKRLSGKVATGQGVMALN